MKRIVHFSHSERGQSLVEMAVMMPLMLVMLAGVLDFGRIIYVNVVLTNAAREVALTGATYSIESTLLENLALQEIDRAGVKGGTPSISIGYTKTGNPAADTIVVDISYKAALVLTFLPFPDITLHSHAEMPLFWSLSE